MSKTDKTRPYWVQVKDSYLRNKAFVEYHDHTKSDCDFDEFTGKRKDRTNCGVLWGYAVGRIFGDSDFGYANLIERQTRAKFRAEAHELRKMSRDAIEDYDSLTPRHRNSAKWWAGW